MTGGLFQGELNPWGLNLNWNCVGLCFTVLPSLSSPEMFVSLFVLGGGGGRQSDPLFHVRALITLSVVLQAISIL